jgi:hypothetical protein
MAAKKKAGTVGKVTEAVKDAAASVAHAAQEHVIQPVGEALGLTGGDKKGGTKSGAKQATKKTAAAPKASAGKGKAKPAASLSKSSPKPTAGAGRMEQRRGASNGK